MPPQEIRLMQLWAVLLQINNGLRPAQGHTTKLNEGLTNNRILLKPLGLSKKSLSSYTPKCLTL